MRILGRPGGIGSLDYLGVLVRLAARKDAPSRHERAWPPFAEPEYVHAASLTEDLEVEAVAPGHQTRLALKRRAARKSELHMVGRDILEAVAAPHFRRARRRSETEEAEVEQVRAQVG